MFLSKRLNGVYYLWFVDDNGHKRKDKPEEMWVINRAVDRGLANRPCFWYSFQEIFR